MRTLLIIFIVSCLSLNINADISKDSVYVRLHSSIDSLESVIQIQQNQIENLEISQNWFDTLVSSQWNIFSTIIFLIIAVIGFISWKYLFRDVRKKLDELEKSITYLNNQNDDNENNIELIANNLEDINNRININKANIHRSLYVSYLAQGDISWACMFAIREIEYFFDIDDDPGATTWMDSAISCLDNPKINKKFIASKKQEIQRILGKKERLELEEANHSLSTLKSKLTDIFENGH